MFRYQHREHNTEDLSEDPRLLKNTMYFYSLFKVNDVLPNVVCSSYNILWSHFISFVSPSFRVYR